MNGRGLAALGILAAWGVGLATYAQREYSRSPLQRLAESAVRVSPGAVYFALIDSAARRHAGFASFTTDTVTAGLQFTEYSVRGSPQGGPSRDVRQVVTSTTRSLGLRSVTVTENGKELGVGQVEADSFVVIRRGSGAFTRRQFRAPLLVPALVPLAIALGESTPEVGDRHSYDVFDPATMSIRSLTVDIVADSTWVLADSASYDRAARRWRPAHVDSVRAWRIRSAGEALPSFDVWVDPSGRLVHARLGAAEIARRTAYELAFENWRTEIGADTRDQPVPTLAHREPRRPTRALTLTITGIPLGKLAIVGEWQQRRGDTVHIELPRIEKGASSYSLPPRRDHRDRFVRELQVEPGIEADAPALFAAARKVRSGDPDPRSFAFRLARWVADSVRLQSMPGVPSALGALKSRGGDADQHTRLYVAMARAIGVPARAVRGLLHMGGAWQSHSWAEVFVSEHWVPVDPTLGEAPADAAHLRLLESGLEAAAELDRLVARAHFSVLRHEDLSAKRR